MGRPHKWEELTQISRDITDKNIRPTRKNQRLVYEIDIKKAFGSLIVHTPTYVRNSDVFEINAYLNLMRQNKQLEFVASFK